jgi:hypothetical protein
MSERTIFNNWLELDCFCMDIAEAWIKYRKSKNQEVSLDEFVDWVMNDLYPALECNFDDVYEEEFGYREDENMN